MKPPITSLATLGFALAVSMSEPVAAQGYPVDCAILLCLAGGWPASAPCAHARAVFIRRITPWPVEPPLQVWNCPMGGGMGALPTLPASDRADIDISAPAFDFVRSVRVYQIDHRQFMNGDTDCVHAGSIRRGDYGTQGEFRWTTVYADAVPSASALPRPVDCATFAWRSVFVDWRDHEGKYGFEEVRY